MATKQVMIGPQILHGADRFGEWVTEGIEGWDEAPAVRSEESARTDADGDFVMPAYYSARTPTLDGILFAKNRGQGLEAIKSLNQAARLNPERLTITDYGMARWAMARYAGLDYTWVKPSVLRWQVRLNCPDPYKYGAKHSIPVVAGSSGYLVNRGNAQAWPVITIEGSMPLGYKVILNGVTIDVVEPLVAGKPHVIDMKKRRITINGVWGYGLMDAPSYPSIRPGARQAISFVPFESGTGQAVVAFNDTYI